MCTKFTKIFMGPTFLKLRDKVFEGMALTTGGIIIKKSVEKAENTLKKNKTSTAEAKSSSVPKP